MLGHDKQTFFIGVIDEIAEFLAGRFLFDQAIAREVRDYLMIALGMVLYSIGWTVFLLPNDIMTGGVPVLPPLFISLPD